MKQDKRGILVVFSGFSGAGKGTVMAELLRRYPEYYALSISATTRQPRVNEQDGREYFFKTREEFEKMIAKNELIEYALYVENYYGTPKAYVEEQLAAGKDVILEIETQGALKVKQMLPDTLFLFVTPNDAATLKKRLLGRGTESEEAVNQRLLKALEEVNEVIAYDYLIFNDTVEECVEEVHSMIQREHRSVSRNGEFFAKMKEDLLGLSKGE